MKNPYLAYDLIRQNKFRTPEKMLVVEKLLAKNDVVINWWCRQSGKSLTSIKIINDFVKRKPSNILIVCTKTVVAGNFMYMLGRTIDRKEIDSISKYEITLKNGSRIKAISANSDSFSVENKDLIVFDEFDFMDTTSLAGILLEIKSVNRYSPKLSLWEKILIKLRIKPQSQKNTKLLFFSSKNSKENFSMISAAFPSAAMNYLNWDDLNLSKDKIIERIGEESFEKEYNSYKL